MTLSSLQKPPNRRGPFGGGVAVATGSEDYSNTKKELNMFWKNKKAISAQVREQHKYIARLAKSELDKNRKDAGVTAYLEAAKADSVQKLRGK
jgi:hypothetical protein